MENDNVTVNLTKVKAKLFDLYSERLFEDENNEEMVVADMMTASEILGIVKELGGD